MKYMYDYINWVYKYDRMMYQWETIDEVMKREKKEKCW